MLCNFFHIWHWQLVVFVVIYNGQRRIFLLGLMMGQLLKAALRSDNSQHLTQKPPFKSWRRAFWFQCSQLQNYFYIHGYHRSLLCSECLRSKVTQKSNIKWWGAVPCQSGWKRIWTRSSVADWCLWHLGSGSGSQSRWWFERWLWGAAPTQRECAVDAATEQTRTQWSMVFERDWIMNV